MTPFVAFINYLLTPSTLIAVIPMLIVSIWALLHEWAHRQTHIAYFWAFLGGLIITPFFSFWDVNDQMQGGLHILFVFMIGMNLLLTNPKKYPITFSMFITLNFLSCLMIDTLSSFFPRLALGLFHTSPEVYARIEFIKHLSYWFEGIGGAGPLDALFFAPIFSGLYWYLSCKTNFFKEKSVALEN